MNTCLISLTSLILVQSSLAAVVTVYPTKDNTIYQAVNGGVSNGAGDYIFAGNSAAGIAHRALVRFNVADAVPAGAQITDAILYLTVSRWAGGFPPAYLHAATKDWGEGTSNASGNEGRGTAASVGDATWTKAFHGTPGVLWTTPGGDFLPEVDAQIVLDGNLAAFPFTAPALISRVRAWHANPTSNFGWIVTGDEQFATTAIRFNSRHNADVASRPRLKITYRCPADFDNSGTVDLFDYLDFVNAFSSELPGADFNGDLVVDFFDYLDYVSAFSGGC